MVDNILNKFVDNVGIINETCKIAGIPRLSPKTIDFEDDAVWNSIRKDTSLVFQMNSNYGQRTVDKVFAPQIYEKIKRQVPNMTRLDLLTFVNALIRPCGKGVYEKATNGIATPSGIKEIDDLLGSSMGYAIMQEPQMAFVMQFCGYDFLHADKLRKIIGKKLGTRDQLPLIKKGWEENAKIRYNLTEEQSEAIIEPFLQCILDATRYSFSLVHSLSYSCISYECAYLRYHYPLEYLTACMNAWNGDDDKTAEAITYAQRNKIRIKPPRFRHSKAEYYFDAEEKAIYRGTSSIKFLNEGVSDELYDMRDEELNSFIDLLYKLKDTGINARQLEILIKLGYFEEFGNACELLKIYNLFDFFKNGEAKTVAKSKIENDNILFGIVSRHANETTKQFNKLDCHAILDEIESYIRTLQIKDLSMKDKIANDMEYTGSISTITGKEEDRPKLIILDKRMLISNRGKDAGKPWGVAITTQSLGSGIQSSMTVDYKQYCKEKFDIHDIIYLKKFHKNNRGYFIVDNYERIFI